VVTPLPMCLFDFQGSMLILHQPTSFAWFVVPVRRPAELIQLVGLASHLF